MRPLALARALALAALALALAAAPAAAQGAAAVDAIALTVADADRSAAFFEQVLGFERVSEVEVEGAAWESLQSVFPLRLRVVRLRLGDETLELHEYLAPRGRPMPADTRGNDLWFQHVAIVVRDMDAAYARLREHRVAHASSGPQTLPAWNPNAGGIRAFYFRDPDGHFLELIWFPPGKGDPRWQRSGSRLFLGIDHTAITVADTDASLRFWRDALGFSVAGESENWGPEQERLNAVFGARLRITGLRAPGGGLGVELLEYLAPRDGRPRPADAQPSDLLHWQTGIATRDAAGLAARVRASNGRWTSPGAVELPADALGFHRGALVADPDGHAVRIAESLEAAAPAAAAME
jgi:catechol 2,3-dioxygenase-like lactoylglutathione lyase family enzyme